MHLTTEPFTVENDLMTPSYKLKRAPLQKRYKKQVRVHTACVLGCVAGVTEACGQTGAGPHMCPWV